MFNWYRARGELLDVRADDPVLGPESLAGQRYPHARMRCVKIVLLVERLLVSPLLVERRKQTPISVLVC